MNGGGDWADDRLIPDILRSFEKNESVIIRNPKSYATWQHVLEPLSGYLILAEKLLRIKMCMPRVEFWSKMNKT